MPLRQLWPDPKSSAGEFAKVDIIAVHGLNPRSKKDADHAWDTWRTPPGPDGRLWLRDDLPQYVPDSRIFVYEYNATAVYGNDQDTFVGKANELLEAIRIKRDNIEARPILLLGHSMGGLLIKQALINAHNNRKYTPIKDATSGLAFFATPHRGGDWKMVSLGSIAAKIATAAGFQKGDNILETLATGSIFSDILQEHWRHQLLEYDIISFWGALDNVVPVDSARLGLPGNRENIVKLNADHGGVCRFGESQTDQDNFELVSFNIREIYKNALKNLLTDHTSPLCQVGQPCHYIPFPKNKRFVGRENIVATLEEILFTNDCQNAAVIGLGGVGKTQVALKFAYWAKENKPNFSIFWVPALSDASFEQAYTEIARKLPIRENKDGNPMDSVRRYLSSEEAGPWLLIVDNADDKEMLLGSSDTPGGVLEYLPQSERGRTLFTSRSREVAVTVAGKDVVELNKMNQQEAESFLEKSLIRTDLLNDSAMTTRLLKELTYLPLAITQATAYLNINQVSIAEYLRLLRGTEQGIIQLMSRQFRDNTRYKDSQNAVATTWLVSFEQIRKSDNAAAELLSFISHIEPKAIPQSILPSLDSEEQIVHAIGTLRGYAFVVRRGDEEMFDMHSLVHLATRIWVQQEGRVTQTIEKATRHLAAVFPSHDYANRSLWREYLPHALRVLYGDKRVDTKERYKLDFSAGRCLRRDGRIKEAVRCFEECYRWRKSHFPEEHPSRLASQHELGRAYKADGQIKKAVELLEHIVVIDEKTLAEEHPHRITSQHELATAYQADGQIKRAVELLEYVVSIREKTLAEEHPDRLASQHGLASAYQANGQIKRAVELLEYVVSIREKTLAEEHPDRLASQHGLASAYQDNGQIKRAVELLEYVVSIREKTLAEEHPDRLASQHGLARAYQADGQIKKAVELLEYIIIIDKKTLTEEHPHRLDSQYGLARAYQADGQIKKAVELLEYIVIIDKKTLAEEHPYRLASQYALALAYEEDAQIKRAVELLEYVVSIREKTLAEEHPHRLASKIALARAYEADRQTKRAAFGSAAIL